MSCFVPEHSLHGYYSSCYPPYQAYPHPPLFNDSMTAFDKGIGKKNIIKAPSSPSEQGNGTEASVCVCLMGSISFPCHGLVADKGMQQDGGYRCFIEQDPTNAHLGLAQAVPRLPSPQHL